MISNPKDGWCEFKLGAFTGHPSYLTDVPMDIMSAFIDYYSTGSGLAYFDEEGTEFNLVLSNYSVYIISVGEHAELYDCSHLNIDCITEELIGDIEGYIEEWTNFLMPYDGREAATQRYYIDDLLKRLKFVYTTRPFRINKEKWR